MADRLALNGLMGAIIGNYRVESLLEQGEWGAVFQVYDRAGTRLLMRFSEKLLMDVPPDVATARLVFLAHFQQEARLIAMLQHPHILPLLDYGNFHGLPYLVYPQLAGSSLSEVMASQGPLSLVMVSQYLQQMTSALDYAHQRGVLHRNLSSACIFIQPGAQSGALMNMNGQQMPGRLFIGEFGFRRIVELSRSDLRVQSGGIQRRPAYDGDSEASAPEQLLGQPIDTYTDVYACGVVLYRLLTGHAPFEGSTRDEVARLHLYAQIPPLHTWRKDVPGTLNDVLSKALAKDPAQRYRRAGELAWAYQEAMQAPETPMPTPTDIVASRLSMEQLRHPGNVSRRRVLALAGAGAGIAAAGLFVGARLLQGQMIPTLHTATAAVSQATVVQGVPQAEQHVQQITAPAQKIVAHASSVPVNSATTFPQANKQRPGVLIHLPDERFVAFDSTCTHAGCGVTYNAQTRLLECPCHGATFDPTRKAAVVSGPAQSPLAPINVQVHSDGTITLN